MFQNIYYVEKTTDTFGDILLAYGLAALLEALTRESDSDPIVRLRDDGNRFAIVLSQPIAEEYICAAWFCDLPSIETRSRKAPPDWAGPRVSYDEQRERNAEYFALRKQLRPEARRGGATVDQYPELAQVEAKRPRGDWQIIAQINQMSSLPAYAQVLETWFQCRACFPELIRLLLALFAGVPNDVEAAGSAWRELAKRYGLPVKDSVTPVQVLNPSMGKGINRAKQDGASRLGNPEGFWALEYLKFWGMYTAGLPRIVKPPQGNTGRGPRDRKTYVLHPVNITLKTHRAVHTSFSERLFADTAVKMDVMAALRYTATYLQQWLAGQVVEAEWGDEPGDHVCGLSTAFYKDMGSAVAVLNLSEIALPRWMRVEDQRQGELYQALLEEHRQVVSSLTERNADEYRLLQVYRNFLSGHDLAAFFEFTAAYSSLLTTRIERGQWAPRFLTTNLEVLIMGHDRKLKPILDSPGFQNIATAIRRSTVSLQYIKARGLRPPYDIRYGLGATLLRSAAYPDRFSQALCEFMQAFNQENAQMAERAKGTAPQGRKNITTDDIDQVVAMIDEYGSQTVGNLLVAYGYARAPWEPDSAKVEPDSAEELADESADGDA